jgi:hypothetical protein
MSTDVSEVRAASIIRAMSLIAARTSERSVDIQLRTLQYIPEDSELHTRRRENLKSHNINIVQCYDLNKESILSSIVWITLNDFFSVFSIK